MFFSPSREIIALNWENVWEWGQGDKAYKLANAGYKVCITVVTALCKSTLWLGRSQILRQLSGIRGERPSQGSFG